MEYSIVLARNAQNDLRVIKQYYLDNVSNKIATKISDKLQKAILSLQSFPERGTLPKELLSTGMTQYRQIIVDVYRIIYRLKDYQVIIIMVIDGRRDVTTALMRRQLI